MKIIQIIAVFFLFFLLSGCETDTMATFHALQAKLFPEKFPLAFDTKCCAAERQFVWEDQNLADFAQVQEQAAGDNRIDIGVIQSDLNDDWRMDLLAQVYSPVFCGAAGCTLHIYVADEQGAYREVQASSNTQTRIDILGRRTNGMRDIVFAGKHGERCIWQWDGEAYQQGWCEKE